MIDYHIHTTLCHHAEGNIEEYVESAIGKGLTEIGFSDHAPMPEWYDPGSRMSIEQFDQYEEMVNRMKAAYGNDISIRFGIEMDYTPGAESFIRKFLSSHEFDFVLGSVHYINDLQAEPPLFLGRHDILNSEHTFSKYYDLLKSTHKCLLNKRKVLKNIQC